MKNIKLIIHIIILLSCICPNYSQNKFTRINSISSNQNISKPYKYNLSIEGLLDSCSEKIMEISAKELTELSEVNRLGKYKADLQSLNRHETPEWYKDSKLGVFLDWGLYSIPGYGEKGWSKARYPDWYLLNMYKELKEYHIKKWGEDFHRDDFLPLFTAQDFNAQELVSLVKSSGAKYLVPFSKHHDGFCLWNSKYTQRDVVDMNPGRDLTEEIITECKKEGIHHGFYFSVDEYEYPIINNDKIYVRYWSQEMAPDNAGNIIQTEEVIGEFDSALHNKMLSGKIPVYNFIDHFILPQAKEYIDIYDPDILWFDGEWQRSAEYYRTMDLVAYFYNNANGRKEVAVNDRLGSGTRGASGDFYTSETDEVVDKMDVPWEENRSMSESYGFNYLDSLENYLTPDELIEMLVRIVAKGGNLNLIVNPDGTGKIPKIQRDLLGEMGAWLEINGEAVYNTVPYEVTCDDTQLGQSVWYTMSKDSLYGYAIIFDWPKSETFICKAANMIWEEEVYMLGYSKPIEWVDVGKKLWGMSAKVPLHMQNDPSSRPCKYAWVLKFKYDKDNKYGS
jgi:alpha-L-fucosidase